MNRKRCSVAGQVRMNRTTKFVAAAITGWCIAVFIYGFVRFPDSPYKPCPTAQGYCGKFGDPHSQAEFEAHRLWQKTLFISWPFGLAAGLFVSWRQKAAKRLQTTRETHAPEA